MASTPIHGLYTSPHCRPRQKYSTQTCKKVDICKQSISNQNNTALKEMTLSATFRSRSRMPWPCTGPGTHWIGRQKLHSRIPSTHSTQRQPPALGACRAINSVASQTPPDHLPRTCFHDDCQPRRPPRAPTSVPPLARPPPQTPSQLSCPAPPTALTTPRSAPPNALHRPYQSAAAHRLAAPSPQPPVPGAAS